jgi:hypothetical protein
MLLGGAANLGCSRLSAGFSVVRRMTRAAWKGGCSQDWLPHITLVHVSSPADLPPSLRSHSTSSPLALCIAASKGTPERVRDFVCYRRGVTNEILLDPIN